MKQEIGVLVTELFLINSCCYPKVILFVIYRAGDFVGKKKLVNLHIFFIKLQQIYKRKFTL